MARTTVLHLAGALAVLAATACGGSAESGSPQQLASAASAKGKGGNGGGGAGTSTVTGVVKDIATGAPLAGVTISDGTHSATTSSAGAYTLSSTATGTATLTATGNGYLQTSQLVTVSSSATSTVDWALTRSYGTQKIPAANMSTVVLAWNDLGMHCDQDDYSYFMVLPPYNTLHAQVIQRGGDSSGFTVSYAFPKKTDSTLHTNFWSYAAQYGYPVAPNVGISGTPLAGDMQPDPNGHGYIAQGIPVTPYDDDGTWDPYGTATLTVKDSTGKVVQTATVVAPVSTEMMCANCHGTTNPQLDILQKHDSLSGTSLAADHAAGKVHACSECHSDNALGAPGKAGVESLSLAMHNFHKDKMSTTSVAASTTPDCYNCHPGPKTQCLRGIMARAGKTCHDCHGDMNAMTSGLQGGRQPWLQEPRCGGCHDAKHAESSGTLYRNSLLQNSPSGDMNGRFYCEACHNGAHAELATANSADPTIPMQLQGDNYWIWSCTVCHTSQPQSSMHR
ncbi:carboxypeptidase-like regulatory domain-containing protein [Anaeromyxobacter oryzisoli]|uniref:carboxypeptidase-like regulatory domain-containing protein n=1 Tax=Anaeromyxobacter oryzisoli TaxID=2925408 RepID=UPI001F5AEF67|nr:carboxypeptidase-like regulatory domain-containing protein [Anaeromyxobacter sp. SG63]